MALASRCPQCSTGKDVLQNHSTASQSYGSVNWSSLCSDDTTHFEHEKCVNGELHLCRNLGRKYNHEMDKARRVKYGPPFRCIDVEKKELVEISLDYHYEALSYVW